MVIRNSVLLGVSLSLLGAAAQFMQPWEFAILIAQIIGIVALAG